MEGINRAPESAERLGAELADAAHRFWHHPEAFAFIDLRDRTLYRKGAARPEGRIAALRAAIQGSPELIALYREVRTALRRYADAVTEWEKGARGSANAAAEWERWHREHGPEILESLCGIPSDLTWMANPQAREGGGRNAVPST